MREQITSLQLEKESPLVGPYKAKVVDAAPDRILFSFTVVEGEETRYALAIPGRMYVNGSDNLLKFCKSKSLTEAFAQSIELNIWLRELRKPIMLTDSNELILNDNNTTFKAPKMKDVTKQVLHYVVLMSPGEYKGQEIKAKLENNSSVQAENLNFSSYWNQVLRKTLDVNSDGSLETNWFVVADVGFTGYSFNTSKPTENIISTTGEVKKLISPFGGIVSVSSGITNELAIFHKTNVYINGCQVGFTDRLELAVGTKVMVDLVENQITDEEDFIVYGFEGKYVATSVHVGDKIVDESRTQSQEEKYKKVLKNLESHRVAVTELFEDDSGKHTSGMALVHNSMLIKNGQASDSMIGEFVKFDGKDLFFCGVNLAGVDLAYLIRPGDMIECKLSMLSIKQNMAQYEMEVGRIGVEQKTADACSPESKGLWKKLNLRSMDFMTAEQIINRKVEPRINTLPEGCALGRFLSLDPPQDLERTLKGTVVIDAGKYKGKKIKVSRSKLSIYGISLEDSDLLYCIYPYEAVYVDVSGIDDYPEGMYVAQYCRLASPSQAEPVDKPDKLSVKDKMGLIAWLDQHGMTYEKFKNVLQQKAPFKYFIPFPQDSFVLNCHLESLDPMASSKKGVTSGTIVVDNGYMSVINPKNGKGVINMKGQKVTFHRSVFWVFGRKMAKSDLSYFLSKNQRIMAECQEITPEEREKNPAYPANCKYRATIAWIGSARPRNEGDPNRNDISIHDWLGKRGLNMKSFQELVDGKMKPHSPMELDMNNFFLPSLPNSDPHGKFVDSSEMMKGQRGFAADNPDFASFMMNEQNMPVLRHGPVMAHMLETCITARGPGDPSLFNLLENDMMAEMALQVSEALRLSLMYYRQKLDSRPQGFSGFNGPAGNKRQFRGFGPHNKKFKY